MDTIDTMRRIASNGFQLIVGAHGPGRWFGFGVTFIKSEKP